MLHQANNVEVAVLWTKALFLWPFLLPLMVHFTLVFTENSLIKKKVTYVLLYGPALIFSEIDLATNLISSAPVRHYWGFDYALPTGSWVSHLDGVWAAALAVFVLVMLAIYYRGLMRKTRRSKPSLSQ